jgi:uncharacterized protein
MSGPSNLARARSHIIFIVGLLAAAAYILWVERWRGVPSEAPPSGAAAECPLQALPAARAEPVPLDLDARPMTPPEGWRVQLGAFRSAEAAGRQWDAIRGSVPGLQPLEIVLVEAGGVIRLQAGPLNDQRQVVRLCEAARSASVDCAVVPPLRQQP